MQSNSKNMLLCHYKVNYLLYRLKKNAALVCNIDILLLLIFIVYALDPNLWLHIILSPVPWKRQSLKMFLPLALPGAPYIYNIGFHDDLQTVFIQFNTQLIKFDLKMNALLHLSILSVPRLQVSRALSSTSNWVSVFESLSVLKCMHFIVM